MRHVIALSGGKDSTAMALRLAEVEPRADYEYIITPTGNELPEMVEHWRKLEQMLGKPMRAITPAGVTLQTVIEKERALPNWRMRFCTRELKIEPTIAWILREQTKNNTILHYVGLRADEDTREGLLSEQIQSRFPMREWGWTLADVVGYLAGRGVVIPERTDCAWCFYQRLGEWRALYRQHPDVYAGAVAIEQRYGSTFRSPGRDTWPADLASLAREFDAGRRIRGDGKQQVCRVCSL